MLSSNLYRLTSKWQDPLSTIFPPRYWSRPHQVSLELEGKTIPHHYPTLCFGVHTLILFTSSKLKEFFQVSSTAWNDSMILTVQKCHCPQFVRIKTNPQTPALPKLFLIQKSFFPICQLPIGSPDMDRDLMDFVWGFSFRWGRSIGVPLGSASFFSCEWKAAAWTLTASLSWCAKKICKSCLGRMPECKEKKKKQTERVQLHSWLYLQ